MKNLSIAHSARCLLASVSFWTLLASVISAQADGQFVSPANIIHNSYDGTSNDLLTAGLGKTGLGSAVPPGFVNASVPLPKNCVASRSGIIIARWSTPRLAAATAHCTARTSTRTATIRLAKARSPATNTSRSTGRGRDKNVTMMVQVPASFNPSQACIITAPSSGSRGVYGAIATAGEWGLKRGCAVAYTDKGTGTGAHNLRPTQSTSSVASVLMRLWQETTQISPRT